MKVNPIPAVVRPKLDPAPSRPLWMERFRWGLTPPVTPQKPVVEPNITSEPSGISWDMLPLHEPLDKPPEPH